MIHEARARLQFVQRELNYEVNRDDALERLRLTYAHILGNADESSAAAVNDPDDAEEQEQDSDVDAAES